ncbi:hypothetical protein M5K25_018422 [Dendrobium thyrsiflorum]|uniref:Uncharacterized protein n=1 Tax=Dendrobium thyrsiflorum TaxID=117978 RepID=A0ABD0UHW3_DENTH
MIKARLERNQTTQMAMPATRPAARRGFSAESDRQRDMLELNDVWSLLQAVNYTLKAKMQLARHTRNIHSRRGHDHSTKINKKINPNAVNATKMLSTPIVEPSPTIQQPNY